MKYTSKLKTLCLPIIATPIVLSSCSDMSNDTSINFIELSRFERDKNGDYNFSIDTPNYTSSVFLNHKTYDQILSWLNYKKVEINNDGSLKKYDNSLKKNHFVELIQDQLFYVPSSSKLTTSDKNQYLTYKKIDTSQVFNNVNVKNYIKFEGSYSAYEIRENYYPYETIYYQEYHSWSIYLTFEIANGCNWSDGYFGYVNFVFSDQWKGDIVFPEFYEPSKYNRYTDIYFD